MKKTLMLAALVLGALPAFAATTTVEFTPAEGGALVAVFSDDGTVSFNGSEAVPYTMDQEASTICSSVNGAENCATFETWGNEVGHVTPYTTSQGSSGTATITAMTE
ncbi:MAG: hypothetical protein RLO80_00835 [Hyphomonas sp.]